MPRRFTDRAIVLRTFNVGEADKFCLLLTERHGRIAARAVGVRRLLSRRGSNLLLFRRVSVTWSERREGRVTLGEIGPVETQHAPWNDPRAFAQAASGIELVLKLTEEGTPMPEVFALTDAFLTACRRHPVPLHLLSSFTLQLLRVLGLLPSFTSSAVSHRALSRSDRLAYHPSTGAVGLRSEVPGGRSLSPTMALVLRSLISAPLSALPPVHPETVQELDRFVQLLLGSQLGSLPVCSTFLASISSAVTPT